MLPEALFNITGLAAIVSTGGFTLDDIDPVRQVFPIKKARLNESGLEYSWLPGTDSNCRPSG